MFLTITNREYDKKIEEALLDQRRRIRTIKGAAGELIDSLGMRHLLIPMDEEEIKAATEETSKNQ